MDVRKCVLTLLTAVLMTACKDASVSSLSTEEINALLVQVDENDEAFIQKNVSFDSIVTRAGQRLLEGVEEPLKIKLFYFGDRVRGYYNLASRDDKNLQVFGRLVDDLWVYKCVTKINMEEAGGYLILQRDGTGIWSNGHVNFRKGEVKLAKQLTEYSLLTDW